MPKTALITGINGQDGSYLTELLLSKNYHVVGLIQNKANSPCNNIKHLEKKIDHVFGNLCDSDLIYKTIQEVKPCEIYNLASQSYPGESWNLALETALTNGIGAHRLFEIVREIQPNCRIYQASSSEMYGEVCTSPQMEVTPFNPINPYAAAKLYAHHIAKIYRQSYKLFISCGILFNHESPRRGMHFITQKITYAAACIKSGIYNSILRDEQGEPIVKDGMLSLGNLDAKRDWGFAPDYVEAMWMMLQQDQPDDFVIGTGISRTIRQLCEVAFDIVGLDWKKYVKVETRLARPTETGPTVANAEKAKKILGWEPKVSFKEFIGLMIQKHLDDLKINLNETA